MKSLKCSLVAVAMLAMTVAATQNAFAQSKLHNAGFESDLGTDGTGIGNWQPFAGSTNASSANDTTMALSGAQHLNLSILGDDNSFAGAFQSLVAAPGQQVDGSFWHKTPDTGLLGVSPELRIEWHGASGELSRVENNGVIPTNDYSLVSVGGIAPDGTLEARLVYAIATFGGEPDGGASSSGTIFLDDAMPAIPEPTSAVLMGIAGLAIATVRRRK